MYVLLFKKNHGSEIYDYRRNYERVQTVQYKGDQLTVKLLPPDEIDPVSHFIASVSSLCD